MSLRRFLRRGRPKPLLWNPMSAPPSGPLQFSSELKTAAEITNYEA